MRYILFIGILFSSQFGKAQNDSDLFRFSKTMYYGTARFEAMGGSFGALGADLSSSQINPAGYGRFSTSNVGISIYGGSTKNTAYFQGNNTQANKGQGGISNFAIVFTEDKSEDASGFIYRQIGFGFNQIERFKNTFTYEGQQFESLLDEFSSQADGYFPEELNSYFAFSTELAYNTYALNYDNISNSYYSLLNNGDMLHKRTVETKGGIGEYFFSYSANYLNKLYLGANIGIRSIRYQDSYSHTETLTDTSNTPLRSFNYDYQFDTKGIGMNIKLGAIYLVSESLRFGIAIHSSTFAELEDNYTASMACTFEDSIVQISETDIPKGNYKYKIRNPGKIVGSVAYVFGTKGCVNLDIDYLNYKNARFKTTEDIAYTPYDYAYENGIAKTVFQDAVNIRLGGELVVFTGFYLRAGIGFYGNAYKESEKVELNSDLIYSGGIGLKTKLCTLDFSYRQRSNKRNYYAFTNSQADINSTTGIFVFSGSICF